MRTSIHLSVLTVLTLITLVYGQTPASTQPTDVPVQDLQAGGNIARRYFLIGPTAGAKEPPSGYGLLVMLPGGDGSATALPFAKDAFQHALPTNFLVAQLVAVKWTASQDITWPMRNDDIKGGQFATEDFVEAVIQDVQGKAKLNRQRIFLMTWDSSGPAGYAIMLDRRTSIKGAFIAMSPFKPMDLPPLSSARSRLFYLYHSPDDEECPFWMVENARDALNKEGARLEIGTYKGGHGWKSPSLHEDIRKGIQWLESSVMPAGETLTAKPPFTDSLETGTTFPTGWVRGPGLPGVTYTWDKSNAFDGKASLSIGKTQVTAQPVPAEWTRTFPYDGYSPALAVSAMVQARGVNKAVLDVLFKDGLGHQQNESAVTIGGAGSSTDHAWKSYGGTVKIPRGTKTIAIRLQLQGQGEIWFDSIKVEYAGESPSSDRPTSPTRGGRRN